MFKSKQRPITIPQWEHMKLAGTLALLWGNDFFDRPPVPSVSLIAGIGLHDRAYGPLDTLPIGETAEDDWLHLTRTGFHTTWSDPVADLIAKLHLKRLVSHQDSPTRRALIAEMTQVIQQQLQHHNLDAETFERIDRLTNLCDSIAFDFCFEEPAEGIVMIFPKNDRSEQIPVGYRVAGSTIQVDPWPFAVDTYVNYVTGYKLDGYPATLDPIIIPYQLVRIVH